MSEKSIRLTTEEVRAILDGRKTQKRIVIKQVPNHYHGTHFHGDKKRQPKHIMDWDLSGVYQCGEDGWCGIPGHFYLDVQTDVDDNSHEEIKPPYQPGDVLWVRETWTRLDCSCCEGDFNGMCSSEPDENEGCYVYRATHYITGDARWRPSIHMPREAARIFLRVTNVRVERLQDITVEDVIAEGIDTDNEIRNPDPETHESIKSWNYQYAQFQYKELWDSLNSKRGYSWEVDPWVWVVDFEREEAANENQG